MEAPGDCSSVREDLEARPEMEDVMSRETDGGEQQNQASGRFVNQKRKRRRDGGPQVRQFLLEHPRLIRANRMHLFPHFQL